MQKLKNKLRGTRGETLVEVLIAMLIAAMATFLLAAMVHAAGEINVTTRERDEHFYAELSAAETQNMLTGYGDTRTDDTDYDVKLQKLTVAGDVASAVVGSEQSFDVNISGGDHLTAYRKQTP